jgi:hypothetical protein
MRKKIKFLPAGIFGTIKPPDQLVGKYDTATPQGLFTFLNNIMKLMIYGAGLFALINFILAGYGFLSANGDSQKVEQAFAKIWQSLIGLLIAAGAFILAGVIGLIVFGDASAILQPKLYKP